MKLFIKLLLCFFALNTFGSEQAITEKGNTVILNDDGTWIYKNLKDSNNEIKTNPNIFIKDSESSFTLKSSKTNAIFNINPEKWIFKKNEDPSKPAEYKFRLKDSDLYGMVVSEQVEVKVEELVKLAFENAKSASQDTKVLKKEYRIVNGNKVIYMEMIGTIRSIKFKYLGYYYSNSSGSTQYLVYTGINLVDKYKTDIDNFLNGFSVNK